MRIIKIITCISLTLLVLLGMTLGFVTYAQEGGETSEELFLQDVGGQGIGDPPASGRIVLYRFSGATDNDNNVATVVHCTNLGTTAAQIDVEFSDVIPTVYTASTTIPPNESRTFASSLTDLYIDHAIANLGSANLNQGAGRVIVPSDNTNVICTAQMIDRLNSPPKFGVDLTLFDSAGNPINTPISISKSPVSVSSVNITGPAVGVTGFSQTFNATASPISATLPITYVWQATNQASTTYIGGLNHTVSFSWPTTGTKAITLSATNPYSMVTTTRLITITPPVETYLPSIIKESP